MELLLWRWSTTAQIASAIVIAVFFVVLARSVRRVELRPWVAAWLANLAALCVTITFWFWQPDSPAAFVMLRTGYFFAKTLFVLLLAAGAWRFVRPPLSRRATRLGVAGTAVFAAVAAVAVSNISQVGVLQSSVTALVLLGAAGFLVGKRVPGAGWLAAGFLLRALLAIAEAAAYATQLAPGASTSRGMGIFLASHSSFDTGAEWVIALGCVLTLYRAIQQELTKTNQDLLAAQSVLQELVDRDPLTGLANRRGLPAILRGVYPTGATILFFDLNDFKEINDSYGHQAGDDCLKRFARALQAGFRPEDHVIRYAGDEFVVVAGGVEPAQVMDRVEQLRARLAGVRGDGPEIRFSVGHALLPALGDADAALREADEAMYRDKASKPRRLRAV
jgi:diguanylate cyclase (GGDEF)-like protein